MTVGEMHSDRDHQIRLVYGLLIALILVTAALRLSRLPDIPPGLWYDEAYNAMDALWMLESGNPQVFFWGNNGREPMLHFMGALTMGILGATPFAIRLVSALVSILTIPLTFKWLVTLFDDEPDRYWLALFATAGLAFSFWYLVMSRTGHRAVLFPLFAILSSYLFWRSWRGGSVVYAVAAGVALGLSQYTYVLARLLPIVFVVFALVWTLLGEGQISQAGKRRPVSRRNSAFSGPHRLWIVLAVMGFVSLLVFLPLGFFFLRHPSAFFARTSDVFILDRIARGEFTVLGQLFSALQVFFGGSDPNWRHNLVGVPGFDLLSSAGFILGILVCFWRARHRSYLFLLISMFVMWLPALMSVPSVYTLRLSGLLPIYYAIMAVGFVAAVNWVGQRVFSTATSVWMRISMLVLIITVSGGLTSYRYFVQWANMPMVYSQYNGPLADLADYINNESHTTDILLPLPTYMHPTSQFLLHSHFRETDTTPSPNPDRPAVLVEVDDIYLIPNMVNISGSSSYAWLTREESGAGVVSVIQLQQPDDLTHLVASGEETYYSSPSTSEVIARVTPVESMDLVLARAAEPEDMHLVNLCWAQQVCLTGYQVLPALVESGQSPILNLYWRGLTSQPSEYKTFIHLINARGDPVGQSDGITVSEEQRWHQGKLSPEQHILSLDPQAEPGAYLVRVGLIDPDTGQRLPVSTTGGGFVGDHVQLGLFYLTNGQTDPRQPLTAISARLGNHINQLGYSISSSLTGLKPGDPVKITLHWQTDSDLEEDYTAFVQLLDDHGQLITGWDSKPLAGQYPTYQWRPGEIVVSEFELSLPAELSAGDYSLVTGMYDAASGQRLVATDENGVRLGNDAVPLTSIRVN